jgi:hypothetical protein
VKTERRKKGVDQKRVWRGKQGLEGATLSTLMETRRWLHAVESGLQIAFVVVGRL